MGCTVVRGNAITPRSLFSKLAVRQHARPSSIGDTTTVLRLSTFTCLASSAAQIVPPSISSAIILQSTRFEGRTSSAWKAGRATAQRGEEEKGERRAEAEEIASTELPSST
jgi:hypothetical protein